MAKKRLSFSYAITHMIHWWIGKYGKGEGLSYTITHMRQTKTSTTQMENPNL
jgi:hypothetical protein